MLTFHCASDTLSKHDLKMDNPGVEDALAKHASPLRQTWHPHFYLMMF
jgi:hypothetical protein